MPVGLNQQVPNFPVVKLQQSLFLALVLWDFINVLYKGCSCFPLLAHSEIGSFFGDEDVIILNDLGGDTHVFTVQDIHGLLESLLRLEDFDEKVDFLGGLNGAREAQ